MPINRVFTPFFHHSILLLAGFFILGFAQGQTVIFSENMGTAGAPVSTIAGNTYQNPSLTFTGTAEIRTTGASVGYVGASGSRNVFFTNAVGRDFQIADISTIGYSDLTLDFGAYKSTLPSNLTELVVEYSTDGTNYTQVFFPAQPTGGGTVNWRLLSIDLPADADNTDNLRLRWRQTSTTTQFRIDDVILRGEESCTAPDLLTVSNLPSVIIQGNAFGTQVTLTCSSGDVANCNEGSVTLTSTACAFGGTLTRNVVNGVANFDDVVINRSPQSELDLTAVYTGPCGSASATVSLADVVEPLPAGVIAQQNYDGTNTWESPSFNIGNQGVFNSSNTVGATGSGLAYYANSCSPAGSNMSISSVTYLRDELLGYASLKFKFKLRVRPVALTGVTLSCGGGGGIDSGENFELDISLDGGPYVRTFTMQGSSDGSYPFNDDLISLAYGEDASYSVNSSPSNLEITLPDGISSASFRMTMNSNRVNEVYIIDDLILEAEEGAEPNPFLIADAGADFIGCNGGPNELAASVTDAVGAVSYQWSPAGGIEGSTAGQTAIANSTATETYTLTATDADGCQVNTQVTVNIPAGPAGLWNNNSNQDWFDCRNWADGRVPDPTTNVTIPAGTDDPIIGSTAVNASAANVQIGNGRSVVLDTEDTATGLEIYGNVSGAGNIEVLESSLIFAGAGQQTINVDILLVDAILNINKPQNHLLSNTDIDMLESVLALNGGVLKLSGAAKLLTEGGSFTPGTADRFVDGVIQRKGFTADVEVVFPTGTLDLGAEGPADDVLVFQPASLTTENTTSTTVFEIQYFHENYNADANPPVVGLSSVSTCNYWIIERVQGSVDAKVGLSWNEAYCFEVNDPDILKVAWRSIDEWEPATIAIDNVVNSGPPFVTGFVTSGDYLNNFGAFAIGQIGSDLNVLPIELISFEAEVINPNAVLTTWTTGAEINNDFFTIERSLNARDFETVGIVQGAGNSSKALDYSLIDNHPETGLSYYRLKQTDFDGSYAYSHIEAVEINSTEQLRINHIVREASGINIFYSAQGEHLQFEVHNVTGKLLYADRMANQSGQRIYLGNLSQGIYLLRLTDSFGNSKTKKFFY